MLVMILEAVPPSLRGELSRWLTPVCVGVYVGKVSTLVRDKLWERAVAKAVFPAHAGMDRLLGQLGPAASSVPRTRGDGPAAQAVQSSSGHVFPAHAGMDRNAPGPGGENAGVPRTRGDGPPSWWPLAAAAACSPHTRGWTADGAGDPISAAVFPAHAGMDRNRHAERSGDLSVPRTRGDGPYGVRLVFHRPGCSPHTRGWTGRGVGNGHHPCVFPAHAGMDRDFH